MCATCKEHIFPCQAFADWLVAKFPEKEDLAYIRELKDLEAIAEADMATTPASLVPIACLGFSCHCSLKPPVAKELFCQLKEMILTEGFVTSSQPILGKVLPEEHMPTNPAMVTQGEHPLPAFSLGYVKGCHMILVSPLRARAHVSCSHCGSHPTPLCWQLPWLHEVATGDLPLPVVVGYSFLEVASSSFPFHCLLQEVAYMFFSSAIPCNKHVDHIATIHCSLCRATHCQASPGAQASLPSCMSPTSRSLTSRRTSRCCATPSMPSTCTMWHLLTVSRKALPT